ncbi:translocation/assembly module TamB domain-containing protein [Fulvivirga ligni]|uniref:translocation/assembly module TamB domain-containing protein n=1 Tax=Fulvivirga ligni TaxID=2904246 RepID=UPI001F47DD22|nr:translocation/assembly module TamB [Fulvivirga ligni]UII24135.1 translocation/assembly module TamB [Fulvivirga ligni]
MASKGFEHILFKILKITGWIILSLILILVIAIFSLRLPKVQEFVTGKALNFFKSKVDTEASIGRLYVDFPKTIVIEDIYIEDQKKDTLVYAHHIGINTDLWGLLDNKFQINDLEVEKLVANIYSTNSDSTFNYQFIVDAFAAQDTTQAPVDTTQTKPFDFSIKEVDIKHTRVRYDDLYTGISLNLNVGSLYTDISEFDLNNAHILVDEIALENSVGSFKILKPSQSSDTTSSEVFDIAGNLLTVNNVKFTFEDRPGNMKFKSDIGKVGIEVDSMSLARQVYVAKTIDIENTFISIDQYTQDSTQVEEPTDTTSVSEEEIEILTGVAQANIKNVGFRLYNHNYEKVDGFDPNHMWFQKLNADLQNIVFKNGYADGKVNSLTASEQGGLSVKSFNAEFKYGEKESFAKNLHLETDHTNITGDLAIAYPSMEAIADNLNALQIDAEIQRSRIDFEDIFYFQPALKESMSYFNGKASQVILQGDIKGSMADMDINNLQAEALNNTKLAIDGQVSGLPDVNKTRLNLKIKNVATSREDIKLVLPDSLIPQNISIPQNIALKGKFKGSLNDFASKLNLTTSYGDALADVKMKLEQDSIYSYAGTVKVDSFKLGKLLMQEDQMGNLSLNMKAEGKGFAIEDLDTQLDGEVTAVDYNGYTYKNISVNGKVQAQEFTGQLAMDDPNADFEFDGTVNLNDSVPHYQFTLDLRTLDLYALNFAKEELKVRAKIISDIRMASAKRINGTLAIDDFVMGKGTHVYQMDTFLLTSKTDEDSTNISIQSNIITAEFKGNFDIVTLPQVLEQHFNRYYDLADVEDVQQLTPQSFDFNINVIKPGFFTDLLVPELDELRPGPIKGNYNSELWELNLDINLHKAIYAGTEVDSLGIEVNSDEAGMSYLMKVAKLSSGSITVDHINWHGDVEADHIKTELMINNDEGETKYMFGGIFISGEDYYRFQFTPGEFILNYQEWDVKPSNRIDIHPSGIWVENMILQDSSQQIIVESKVNDKSDSTLAVNIENFSLGALGKLEESDVYLINGILNGEFNLNMEEAGLAFTSDLDINQFSYKGDTVGNVTVVAFNEGGNKYNLDLDIKNSLNNVKVDGYYLADSVPEIHLDANLVNLDLSTIESFTMGQLTEMKGSINGLLKIRGTTADPDIAGKLNFNQARFKAAYVQTTFKINNESLNFTKTGISFNDFVINDVNGNAARINGDVATTDYSFYKFDLKLKTDNFLLLNTSEDDNELYYGKIELNCNATITGNSDQPNVQMDVGMSSGSELTYVIPEAQITEQQTEGIVTWFDADVENDPFYQQFNTGEQEKDTIEAQITGININADINIDQNNTLNVVIDPVTGDKLAVKGNANLKLGIKPNGDMTLAGRYEVFDGSYNLNFYGLVKREFKIQRGSYLLWTGDVLNARMDISAVYTVRATPPAEATSSDVSSQKLPFLVYTDIQGELLSPEISFRLALEEGAPASTAVVAYVNQLNNRNEELDQQVFGLLLFKNFLTGTSSNSSSNNVAQTTARNSVSKILNTQLSKLSNKVKGVELSLNLESNGAPTNSDDPLANTQLELGLSKQLFNDRVVVKVAGNFNLDQSDQNRQQSMNDFAGDLRIEYRLTEDGRFRLVGFRENEYDNFFQGGDDVVKTGVGVIFVRDYDSFKELFKAKDNTEKEDAKDEDAEKENVKKEDAKKEEEETENNNDK